MITVCPNISTFPNRAVVMDTDYKHAKVGSFRTKAADQLHKTTTNPPYSYSRRCITLGSAKDNR